MAVRYDLEQPERRSSLIADLVEGSEQISALARRYGVTTQSVYEFRQRHAGEIAGALELVRRALAETWTAVKAERVAAMTADIDLIEEQLARPDLDHLERAAYIREKRAHLRAIADELGDIPRGRIAGDGDAVVRFVIEGVDLDAV